MIQVTYKDNGRVIRGVAAEIISTQVTPGPGSIDKKTFEVVCLIKPDGVVILLRRPDMTVEKINTLLCSKEPINFNDWQIFSVQSMEQFKEFMGIDEDAEREEKK